MLAEVVSVPVGFVRGGRTAPMDDSWDAVEAVIALDKTLFGADAVVGLNAFSHIEVIFHFNRVAESQIVLAARHPRERADWPKVGIFAQRGRARPNRLGVSMCRLLSVDGLSLTVRGLDAIAGTPVLDIKPVMQGFLPRGEIRQPAWAAQIMQDYW